MIPPQKKKKKYQTVIYLVYQLVRGFTNNDKLLTYHINLFEKCNYCSVEYRLIKSNQRQLGCTLKTILQFTVMNGGVITYGILVVQIWLAFFFSLCKNVKMP